ncbi:uncharacterized protein PFL1_03870 [Pseudozyma flocculosa PF-1]|uniref:Cyclin-domain-containing protein n=2 Tax=Pseudozyma flocculosa TaxID=84751 RepID=A0A5C3EWQ4_9BASI|nr:uncharacterized protein PFL1_03870 [Pseudozyma flocculosa PF-1]EPQ28566.1 hypothetical protein PFL1_03870 [Pseudozyma flocculosa PF-1]SPO36502.1 uncharacterized protein PSFLO_01973 [Pseudozyma flocculosa]
MPSKSPNISASSPGPVSSQSSSSGSHYSSSASSFRQVATSDTSSVHTSPSTATDSFGTYRFSPATKGIWQAQYDVEGSPHRGRHQQHQHVQYHHHHNHQQQQHQQQQQQQQQATRHALVADPAYGHRPQPPPMDHGFEPAVGSRTQPALASIAHGGSSPAMSQQASRRFEAGWPSVAVASSSHVHPYGHDEPMAIDQHNVHAGVVHDFGTSPEASRGPLAKTRRTSPGGSRASGELRPTTRKETVTTASSSPAPRRHDADPAARQTPFHQGIAAEVERSTPGTLAPGASSAQAPFDRSWSAGTSQYQPGLPHGDSSHTASTMRVSPRTRTVDVSGRSPASTTSGRGPRSPSAHAAASMSTPAAPRTPQLPKMNLATFPPQELLKVLATLLHEIATANDEFRTESGKAEGSRRSKSRSKEPTSSSSQTPNDADAARTQPYAAGAHLSFNDARRPSTTTAALGALATPSSTLCFHARNVPSISIESYLLRILKYCPTTNEVFLSLLVYFDRMSRMGTGAKPGANSDTEIAGEAAGLPRAAEMATRAGLPGPSEGGGVGAAANEAEAYTHPGIKGFAIDSYNVHRLVIAGVTVASKFFSDVFYTNSRYAKVGGLPVHELNQLELQFLLLNDFRLTIPLDEMQRYADQLLMYGSGRPENVSRVKEPSRAAETGAAKAEVGGSRRPSESRPGPVAVKSDQPQQPPPPPRQTAEAEPQPNGAPGADGRSHREGGGQEVGMQD